MIGGVFIYDLINDVANVAFFIAKKEGENIEGQDCQKFFDRELDFYKRK